MSIGAATSEGSQGENISHFAAIRVRANGVGNLNITVWSLDFVKGKILVPIPMGTQARIIPTRLVNFSEQRVLFELGTTGFDEEFRINRIVIFAKEIYKSYPG